MNKRFFNWSAVVVGVLIAATELMGWSGNLNYLWAVLVLIWGFVAMGKK